jgi:hypothetical protein
MSARDEVGPKRQPMESGDPTLSMRALIGKAQLQSASLQDDERSARTLLSLAGLDTPSITAEGRPPADCPYIETCCYESAMWANRQEPGATPSVVPHLRLGGARGDVHDVSDFRAGHSITTIQFERFPAPAGSESMVISKRFEFRGFDVGLGAFGRLTDRGCSAFALHHLVGISHDTFVCKMLQRLVADRGVEIALRVDVGVAV